MSRRRMVVKAGTQVLLGSDGLPGLARLGGLVEGVAALWNQGWEVALVTSGATGLGARRMGLPGRPGSLAEAQACAAVGQGELMGIYQQAFARLGRLCAQVLLTQEDFGDARRRASLGGALEALLSAGVVPVVNENDTVATLELERMKVFGDNDQLSALLAVALKADRLVILSDVEGLHSGNPQRDPDAALIREVPAITPEILSLAEGGNERGRGGMATKLQAAHAATREGIEVLLAPGLRPGVLEAIAAGESVGTRFLAEVPS